jgi:hypothetical protein
MSALSIQPIYPIFTDIDGQPLEAGYVWIGQANLDPQVNPINVYWDAALSIPATQPIRTLGGYPSRNGTPARLYVNSDYSIRVMNKNGSTIYSAPAATERINSALISNIDASQVAYNPAGTGAVATTVQAKLRNTVSRAEYASDSDYDSARGALSDRLDHVVRTEGGAQDRLLSYKLNDNISVRDSGALGNNNVDDRNAISDAPFPKYLPRGTYRIDSSLRYGQDELFHGAGRGFKGTIIKPSGNFSAFVKDDSQAIDYTRNDFANFQIDASNITSDYAVKLEKVYLTSFQNIWIRNSYNGISLQESDAVEFNNVTVMENSNNIAVLVGNNARSIKFHSSNFEKNPGNANPGGTVQVDGSGVTVSSGYFYGCQIERGQLLVNKGVAYWSGGKLTDANILLSKQSQGSVIEAQMYGSTCVRDFGYGNRIRNAACVNMMTPLHQWPELSTAAGASTYGTGGDEYTYLVTAGVVTNTTAYSCRIEIQEGASVVALSPNFDFAIAQGNAVGQQAKDKYTFLTTVRNTTVGTNVAVDNASLIGTKGGKNLLTNGTFNGGSGAGWTAVNAGISALGQDIVVIPGSAGWAIYQPINTVLKKGKRYIAVAKFSGAAYLCLGNAWDGTVGSRVLIDEGASGIYDYDNIAMLSFEYTGTERISLGNISAGTPVEVRWISVIEC